MYLTNEPIVCSQRSKRRLAHQLTPYHQNCHPHQLRAQQTEPLHTSNPILPTVLARKVSQAPYAAEKTASHLSAPIVGSHYGSCRRPQQHRLIVHSPLPLRLRIRTPRRTTITVIGVDGPMTPSPRPLQPQHLVLAPVSAAYFETFLVRVVGVRVDPILLVSLRTTRRMRVCLYGGNSRAGRVVEP